MLDHHCFLRDPRRTALKNTVRDLPSLRKVTILADAGVLESVLKTPERVEVLAYAVKRFELVIEVTYHEPEDFDRFGGKFKDVSYDCFIESVGSEVHALLDSKR